MNVPRTLALVAALAVALPMAAGAQSAATSSTGHAADNTALNARDRNDMSQTSTAQSNDQDDIKLAAAVRKAVTGDTSLSTLGHNVKILAANGSVTLRGPVKDDAEKAKVESTVRSVNGVQQVTNELDVKH